MTTQAFEQLKPAAPSGVRLRHFQGPADYSVIAEITTASDRTDRIEETTTVDGVANEFAHLDGCDPDQDFIFADSQSDGSTVGFAKVYWRINDQGQRLYWQRGYLLAEWRRRGIGRAMLHYTQGRARAHAQANRLRGPSFVRGVAEDTALGRVALFESEGYRVERHYFFMGRTGLDRLPEARLPSGLELRPATPDDMRAIWNAKEEAFRDHWGHVTKSEADYQCWLNDPSLTASLWQIAWDAARGEIAGVSLNSINEEDNRQYGFKRGWVNSLGVRRPWRRRGLARAILVSSLQRLNEHGMTEVVLGVDAETPTGALRLYESVGFKVLNRDTIYQKEIRGWRLAAGVER
jgi:ribosomal protein S18 acetylase RimI-like enzyme